MLYHSSVPELLKYKSIGREVEINGPGKGIRGQIVYDFIYNIKNLNFVLLGKRNHERGKKMG